MAGSLAALLALWAACAAQMAAAQAVDTCPAADWRSMPIATQPTPFEDFLPELAEYYQAQVVPAVWPAVIGLGASLVVLLTYLLWRLARCCCRCCCRRCCRQPPLHGQKTRTKRCLSALKLVSLILLAGVTAGAIYGFLKVDANLVDSGVATVAVVRGYIANVLGAVRQTLDRSAQIDAVLLGVQSIVDSDVNATDITAQLICLKPWLDGLPDPGALISDVEGARATLDITILPALADLSAQLAALQPLLAAAAPAGDYAATLEVVGAAGALLNDPSGGYGLVQQMQAVIGAVNALPGSEDKPAMAAVGAALNALLTVGPGGTPLSLAAKANAVGALQTALPTGLPAMRTDKHVAAAAADLADLQAAVGPLAATTLPGLAATLRSVEGQYVAVQPCMGALLERAVHINQTVLVLPEALGSQVALLQEAQAELESFIGSSPSPVALAATLDSSAADAAAALADLAAAQTALGSVEAQLASIPADLSAAAAAAGALESFLLLSGGGLATLQASIASYTAAAGSNPGTYAALTPAAQAAAAQMQVVQAQLAPRLPQLAALVTLAQQAQAALVAFDLPAQQASVAALQAAAAAVPDTASLSSQLGAVAGVYQQLPSPKSALLDQAGSEVESIVAAVTQAISEARGTIADKAGEVGQQLDEVQEKTLGNIDKYEARYLPDIRKYDKYRLIAMYGLFGLALFLALLLLAALLLNWPAGVKLLAALTLLLVCLFFVLVPALTVVLKVGNDGCVNAEELIAMHITDGLEGDAVAKVRALSRYYLYGEGGSIEAVALSAFGLDVPALLQDINATQLDVAQSIAEQYDLQPRVAAQVDAALVVAVAIMADIAGIVGLASYATVHPVYATVKSFACCEVLDLVGGIWVALIIAGCFALLLCVAALCFIGSCDKMPPKRSCSCFKRADFVEELPWLAAPPKQGGPAGSSAPPSPAAQPGRKPQFVVAMEEAPGNQPAATAAGGKKAVPAAAAEGAQPGSPLRGQAWDIAARAGGGGGATAPPIAAWAGGSGGASTPSSPLQQQGAEAAANRWELLSPSSKAKEGNAHPDE